MSQRSKISTLPQSPNPSHTFWPKQKNCTFYTFELSHHFQNNVENNPLIIDQNLGSSAPVHHTSDHRGTDNNCLLVAYRPSNMLVYLGDGSACTISTCCHTEVEAADPTFYLTQSQYTDTRPTSPSTDPITPGAW